MTRGRTLRKLPTAQFFASVFLMTAGAGVVQAQSINFCFTNSSSYIIYLRAFSANRNFVWPATGGWVLDDRIQHCVSLACSPGEQICYGGTNNAGTDWGVGYSKSHGCTACCGVCDNSTYGTNLLD
jgi:hypothetical protein